jgi:hypothetical protein
MHLMENVAKYSLPEAPIHVSSGMAQSSTSACQPQFDLDTPLELRPSNAPHRQSAPALG